MKRQFVWILLLGLLLTGCAQDPKETSTPPAVQGGYPTPLEDSFYVLCDRIDGFAFLSSPYFTGLFVIVSKEPLEAGDITVQSNSIQWKASFSERKKYKADNIISQSQFYKAFLPYKDVDWAGMYDLSIKAPEDIAAAVTQYMPECSEKWEAWFPEFYCYLVRIEPVLEDLTVDGVLTETDLTVTVKGTSKVLKDVLCFSVYEEAMPASSGPLGLVAMAGSALSVYPTREGYFYSGDHTEFRAAEDLTITGARFVNSPNSSFVQMKLIVGNVRMDWDGKTPVEVAAGETVKFLYSAVDPTLGDVLTGSFTRMTELEYTSAGETKQVGVLVSYADGLDPYECYAAANGRAAELLSYYADFLVKDSGWQPGYISNSYDGTGPTGNPFLDY